MFVEDRDVYKGLTLEVRDGGKECSCGIGCQSCGQVLLCDTLHSRLSVIHLPCREACGWSNALTQTHGWCVRAHTLPYCVPYCVPFPIAFRIVPSAEVEHGSNSHSECVGRM